MPITLKNAEQIERMRAAGVIVRDVLDYVGNLVVPGITTAELDQIAHSRIRQAGAEASFFGYNGFPAALCISVNEEVIHGIPGERVINDGDLVSLDVGVFLNGYHADAAITVGVGDIDATSAALIRTAEDCFWAGVAAAGPGGRMGDIAFAVAAAAEANGFAVVREFAGHGIGRRIHEEPDVPNWGRPGSGTTLRPGMTFALEPMVLASASEVVILDDGWTAVPVTGVRSAHYEHTIAITAAGVEVLTTGVPSVV